MPTKIKKRPYGGRKPAFNPTDLLAIIEEGEKRYHKIREEAYEQFPQLAKMREETLINYLNQLRKDKLIKKRTDDKRHTYYKRTRQGELMDVIRSIPTEFSYSPHGIYKVRDQLAKEVIMELKKQHKDLLKPIKQFFQSSTDRFGKEYWDRFTEATSFAMVNAMDLLFVHKQEWAIPSELLYNFLKAYYMILEFLMMKALAEKSDRSKVGMRGLHHFLTKEWSKVLAQGDGIALLRVNVSRFTLILAHQFEEIFQNLEKYLEE